MGTPQPQPATSQGLPLAGGGQSETADSGVFGPHATPFEAVGGETAVRSLVDVFYDEMERNPAYAVIRSLHPPDLTGSRDKLFEFLCGWLGGPQLFIQKRGHPRLRMRHAPFAIGEIERDQWLACMTFAMTARGIKGDLRAFLDQRLAHVANFMRNQ